MEVVRVKSILTTINSQIIPDFKEESGATCPLPLACGPSFIENLKREDTKMMMEKRKTWVLFVAVILAAVAVFAVSTFFMHQVDNNSAKGTGYGSIDTPTPVQPLATIAETGEPISSIPAGPWEGPSK